MFAVIETGGKQYRVAPGDLLEIERRAPVAGEEGTLRFDRVLLVSGEAGLRVGDPLVKGAEVDAEVVGEVRGPKIKVFKFKRRKHYRRTTGHRQDLLRVRIGEIRA